VENTRVSGLSQYRPFRVATGMHATMVRKQRNGKSEIEPLERTTLKVNTRVKQTGQIAALTLLTLGILPLGGCFIGGMVENARRDGTIKRDVEAEYDGLKGKSVAVVVSCDRTILADFPTITNEITTRMHNRLNTAGAAGSHSDTDQLLAYLYNRPGWQTRPLGELAKELKVQRLIFVDLQDFRLREPGNTWLWEGVAAGSVSVVEADGPAPDDFAFSRTIRVTFPDDQGQGPAQLSGQVVASELLRRFCERSTWLFFKHEEEYYIKY